MYCEDPLEILTFPPNSEEMLGPLINVALLLFWVSSIALPETEFGTAKSNLDTKPLVITSTTGAALVTVIVPSTTYWLLTPLVPTLVLCTASFTAAVTR